MAYILKTRLLFLNEEISYKIVLSKLWTREILFSNVLIKHFRDSLHDCLKKERSFKANSHDCVKGGIQQYAYIKYMYQHLTTDFDELSHAFA